MLVVDSRWIIAAALLSLRLGAVWALTPLTTMFRAPAAFRIIFTLALSTPLAAALPVGAWPSPTNLGSLALGALSELMLGAVLALGLHAAFGALHFAGRLIDLQVGFGAGGVFDPTARAPASALSMALQWLGIVVFFALDGHHAILRAIAFSLDKVPLGTPFFAYSLPAIVGVFGSVFTLAILVSAPVLAAMLVLEGALAMVSKALPQINIFFVSVPLRIFVGLGMLFLASKQLAPVIGRGWRAVFDYWQQVLG